MFKESRERRSGRQRGAEKRKDDVVPLTRGAQDHVIINLTAFRQIHFAEFWVSVVNLLLAFVRIDSCICCDFILNLNVPCFC